MVHVGSMGYWSDSVFALTLMAAVAYKSLYYYTPPHKQVLRIGIGHL